MKLVLIGPTYPFKGGISHYTTLLHDHLAKKHQVKFFCFSRRYPKIIFPGNPSFDKSKNKIKPNRRAQRIIDWANPLSWFLVAWKIRKFKPDLVIFPWWIWCWAIPFTTISFLTKILTGAKILFLCHEVRGHHPNWWKNILIWMTLVTGDYYFCHSKADFKRLNQMFLKTKVKRIALPTCDVFKSNPVNQRMARKILGISGNSILIFGLVRPYKGLKYLIEALPQILKKVQLNLLIVGEFWEERRKYQKLIEKYQVTNQVKIINGYVPNEMVGVYFSAADLVILPYISAGGTGVTQLAFSFKKPVIGTKVGDLPEVISHGRRGLVVPPRSSKKLAKAIIKSYQKKLIPVFRKYIVSDRHLFSWDKLVKEIENCLIK